VLVDHQVIGTVMPVLEMKLEPGESVVAELPLPNLASAINPYITHPEGKGDGGGGIHFGSDD
jgi:hypothetical protein